MDAKEEAEKLAAEKAEAEKKLLELTPEDEEKIFIKKFGVPSSELMKKTEQVKVLSEDEKKQAEEKEQSDILKFALDQGYTSAKEQEEYITAIKADKVDLARKKFIAQNPELGKDAEAMFNTIFKINEDDEISDGTGEAEKLIPNTSKKAALALAAKIAEEEINTKYSKFKKLPETYRVFKEQEVLKKSNTELINKSIAEIPRRYETEVDGVKIGIDLSEDDFKTAFEITQSELLKKDLKPEEIKTTVGSFLMTKNVARLLKEGVTLAYAKGRDDEKRGAKAVSEDDKNKGSGGESPKMAKLKEMGIV